MLAPTNLGQWNSCVELETGDIVEQVACFSTLALGKPSRPDFYDNGMIHIPAQEPDV